MRFFYGLLSFVFLILLNSNSWVQASEKIQRFPFSQYQLKNIKNSCSDSEFKINEEKIRDFLKKAVVIDEKTRHDRYLNLPCNATATVQTEGKSYALKINSGKTAELTLSSKQTLILGCNRCTSWGEAYSEKGSAFSLKNYSLKDIQNSCSDFNPNENQIKDFLSKAVVLDDAANLDGGYDWVNCNVTATLTSGGKTHSLTLNAGKTAVVKGPGGESTLLGCQKCGPPFLED